MKKIYKSIKLFIVLLSVVSIKMNAQNCFSASQYPSGTVNIASTATTNITTCNFAGEYSVLNFTAAGAYNFSATGGAGNYLTITDNSNNPIGAGYALLGVVIPSVGVYRCHVSLSPGCGTDASCHNVAVSAAAFCSSASQYPSGTISIANTGITTITTCNFGGEYSVDSFTATGIYTVNATGGAGNYITVKNAAGTIIYAQGTPPLAVNIAYTGLYRIHLAVAGPTACTTDASCHTVNVTGPAPAGCAGVPAAASAVSNPSIICAGANSTLSLSTTYTAGGIAYQWYSASALAGPYTSIASATLSSYNATALTTNTFYTAVITCTNGPASATAAAVQVSVNPLPILVITPSSPSICVPGSSSVVISASGASNYTWAPSASLSSSVGASVNALPGSTTIYTITGASASGCIKTGTTTITVNIGVVMNSVTVNPASICAGGNATLMASASSPSLSYCQGTYATGTTFGDYISSVMLGTLTNTSIGLAAPYYTLYPQSLTTTTLIAGNTYTINLQAGTYTSNDMAAFIDYNQNGSLTDGGEKLGEVDNLGAAPTSTDIVFTVPLTAINGTVRLRVREMDHSTTNDIDPCAVQSSYGETEDYIVTITGGVNPILNYTWTPSTFLSSTSTGTTFANAATATTPYTVAVTNANGCSASGVITVSVNANPTVAITGTTTVCNGQPILLTAGGANTYSWSTSATTSTISDSPVTNTTYNVIGTDLNNCSNTATFAVTVNPNPTITVAGGAICAGGSFTLNPSGATTYTFSSGPVVTPTATSSYSITGTDALGCVSAGATVASVTVNATPTLVIGTSTLTVCAGNTVNIGITGASTYTWSTGANGASISPTVNATGSYSVIGDSGAGCTSTASVTITANAIPTVSAISSLSLICVGQTATLTASGAATYSWNTTATSTVITVSPTVTTSYTVTGSTNGCSSNFVVSQAVSPCTGIDAKAASSIGVLVYPNPNTGEFTIELNNGSVKNIQVMDLTGRVIISNTTSNDKIDFNINTLANGVYYIKIQSNNTVEVIKIVKQ
ncbi:MAG: GEVED domain-containing protein [Bacteroidia bacterium]